MSGKRLVRESDFRETSVTLLSVLPSSGLSPRLTSRQINLTKGRVATARERYSLYFTMSRPFSAELPFFVGHLDSWFLGSTRVRNSNGISIGSAVFSGSTQ